MTIVQAALIAVAVWFAVVLVHGLYRASRDPREPI